MTPTQPNPCDEPLPDLAEEAIRLFNAGEYHAQHDLFEEVWREEPRQIRDLYQGVLQVGLAYYHIVEGNRRGALKMFKRSERWLKELPDACQTIDVAALKADAAHAKAAVLALTDKTMGEFDKSLLQPVKRTELGTI
ncbi:MAG: DUF309 domain-containing protein [Anaerolineae bacterium]|nr:DUF309 domain-containing protein [Anaerolineae bacterium]